MLYKDNKLSRCLTLEIYRLENLQGIKKIKYTKIEPNDLYDHCEFLLCKQGNSYFILGAEKNSVYKGYKIKKQQVEYILNHQNPDRELVEVFNKFHSIAFA